MYSFALSFLCSIAFANSSMTVNEFGPVKVGKALPTIAGWTLKENLWSSRRAFSNNKNITIISYFSTSCKPCIPGLKSLHKLNNDETNVILVALEQSKASVEIFLKKHNVKADEVILDKYSKIAQRHGVASSSQKANIPKTFLMDKSGVVRVIYKTEGSDFETHIKQAMYNIK